MTVSYVLCLGTVTILTHLPAMKFVCCATIICCGNGTVNNDLCIYDYWNSEGVGREASKQVVSE